MVHASNDTFHQFLGQALRRISGGRFLKYEEEKDGFIVPERYQRREEKKSRFGLRDGGHLGRQLSQNPQHSDDTIVNGNDGDGEAMDQSEDEKENHNIVTWYSEDDEANPQNWSAGIMHLKSIKGEAEKDSGQSSRNAGPLW